MKQKDPVPILNPYNPLDIIQLGNSVMAELLRAPLKELPLERFLGAGVYSLYYFGDHPLYAEYSQERPIYVGKAVPEGARKGDRITTDGKVPALFNRLREHFDSIQSVADLDERDFKFRCIAVEDIWIPLAESLLIQRFRPVWNVAVDGFGNHDPGKGRSKQQRSQWDTIHPGREWSLKLSQNNLSPEDIKNKVRDFLSETKDLPL